MKYVLLTILSVLLVVITACSDFLDENPKDFLSPENLPVTEDDCDLMLNGAISYLRGSNLYERCLMALPGLGGDDVNDCNSSGNYYEMDTYTFLSTQGMIYSVWTGLYDVINETNTMIMKIPQAELDEPVKEKYIAAAKFLRALMYFHLVRIFGHNCILLDKPVDDFAVALELEPASIEQVYELIKEDIDYAVGDGSYDGHRLPINDWPVGHPTYGAAKTLQAKIYLTMAGYPLKKSECWSTARDASYEVMNMPRYELWNDVKTMWLIGNEHVPEFIYSIENHLPDYGSMWPVQTRVDGWRMFVGNDDYYKAYFEENDLRREAYHILEWDGKPYSTFRGKCPYIGKWVDIGREKLSDYSNRTNSNFPVFRISEVYLMFAEAENELSGPTSGAYNALNATRTRAGLEPLSGLTKEQFKNELIRERARELTFEIKRRYDLHRWELLEEVLSADPKASTNFKMAEHEYYPVPEREVALNPNLGN
ncbi:MAG: RagB/SusD family nutrient uptake outer membrane protein [Mangrovibacterium sp.]